MRRHAIRALMAGLIFIIGYYSFQLIRELYLSYNYVPEIIKSYDSVDDLQHKVIFGVIVNPMRTGLEVLGLITLGIITYFVARKVRRKR